MILLWKEGELFIYLFPHNKQTPLSIIHNCIFNFLQSFSIFFRVPKIYPIIYCECGKYVIYKYVWNNAIIYWHTLILFNTVSSLMSSEQHFIYLVIGIDIVPCRNESLWIHVRETEGAIKNGQSIETDNLRNPLVRYL